MSDLTYTKLKEERRIDTDTTETVYTSYTDKLSSIRTEISKDIRTSQNELLKDIVSCLDVLNETEDVLTIRITKRFGQPKLITKTWTVKKEYNGK